RISTIVVLPAPLGPSKQKTSPRATSKLTPRTALTSPYERLRSRTSIAGDSVLVSREFMALSVRALGALRKWRAAQIAHDICHLADGWEAIREVALRPPAGSAPATQRVVFQRSITSLLCS